MQREFSSLKIRFRQGDETLDREDLGYARMTFYRLCIRASAACGHDPLYRNGVANLAMLRSNYEWNLRNFLEISMGGTLAGRRDMVPFGSRLAQRSPAGY